MIGKRNPKTQRSEPDLDLAPPEMSYAAREALRSYTPARVALQRTGVSLATRPLLDFQLAHARARDAVHGAIDVRMLCDELRRSGLPALALESGAGDRATYLRRPDLGRALSKESAALLTPGEYDVVFVIADGLSALAVERHALRLLREVLPLIAGWRLAPVCVVEQGRVAVGDAIGEALQANLAVVLIGERPGLSLPGFPRRLHYLAAAARQERRGTELHFKCPGRGIGLRNSGGQVALLHARSIPAADDGTWAQGSG